jgi:hypothetical protein
MLALDFESSTGPKELDECEDCPVPLPIDVAIAAPTMPSLEKAESEDQTGPRRC